MEIKKVTVFGSGHLGSYLAFLIAYQKFDVTIFDLDLGLLEEARTKFREIGDKFKDRFGVTTEDVDAALARLAYSAEITEASGNANIVIEAIPEDLQIKKEFFLKLGKVAPKETIFVTSSSHLLPDNFARETGRPEKFLGIHFPDELWKKHSVEIIEHRQTNPKITEVVAGFIEDIGMDIISSEKKK